MIKQTQKKLLEPTPPGGFALIATTSILSLVLMITLALLSLATESSKSTSHTYHIEQAKSNARLALAEAMGELQNSLGPDQRVSAWSNILDNNPDTIPCEGVEHPYYLGVWDSWNTYINEPMKTGPGSSKQGSKRSITIQDTYQKGRHQRLFHKWLVSHPLRERLEHLTAVQNDGGLYAADPTSEEYKGQVERVTLVGKGSQGNRAQEVQAGLVNLKRKSKIKGKFAWWVGSNNLRAPIGDHTSQEAFNDEDLQVKASELALYDPSPLKGLELFPHDKKRTRNISLKTAEISTSPEAIREHFFDLTAYSHSLFSNVRRGGTKHDLNLLFEMDNPPAEFTSMAVKHKTYGNTVFDASLRNYETDRGSLPQPQNPHILPSSWRYMREYYRLYKSGEHYQSYNGKAVQWDNQGVPYTEPYIASSLRGRLHETDIPDISFFPRLPIILRFAYIIGVRSVPSTKTIGSRDLFITSTPVVIYWNPYNVELRFKANEIALNASLRKCMILQYKLNFTDATPPTNWKVLSQTRSDDYAGLADMEIFGEKRQASRADIRLKPGEIKIFTPHEASNRRAYEGFQPPTSGNVNLVGASTPLGYTVSPGSNPSIALRFATQRNLNAKWPENHYWWGMDRSGMTIIQRDKEFGRGVHNPAGETFDVRTRYGRTGFGMIGIDWLEDKDNYSMIVPESSLASPRFDMVTDEITNIAVISYQLKTSELLAYSSDVTLPDGADDFRNRTFLHTNYFNNIQALQSPNDLKRSLSAYCLHYTDAYGNSVGDLIQNDGPNAFGGNSYTADGVKRFVAQELPTAPITNLASFSTLQLVPTRATMTNKKFSRNIPKPFKRDGLPYRIVGHIGAGFGPGIGNGYAHPMIPLEKLYFNSKEKDGLTKRNFYADHWDNLAIANDALWDDYFCSSLTPNIVQGMVSESGSLNDVGQRVFNEGEHLNNRRIRHIKDSCTLEDLIDPNTGLPTDKGYQKIGSALLINGGFNINCTSPLAWKALLHGLKHRKLPFYDDITGENKILDDPYLVLTSRFRRATGEHEATSPTETAAWNGIRNLTDIQINRLAEEIARQVKYRGPFLNMSEFINRRFDDRNRKIENTNRKHHDLSIASALQSAIDWDEFNKGYDGSIDTSPYQSDDTIKYTHKESSINARYKEKGMMITKPTSKDYPSPRAAVGSRYAGIPGYVMASDLLQGIGSVLTPRCDSFTVRAYGCSCDENGNVLAEVWCEAIVERSIQYVDSSDDNWEPACDSMGKPLKTLSKLNKDKGRRLRLRHFKWLNIHEV